MADEPTASLDRANADNIIALLREAASGGKAVLVATHDPALQGASDVVIEIERLTHLVWWTRPESPMRPAPYSWRLATRR